MGTEYHVNGVLTGAVDSFCLSCETYLKMEDVHKHIADQSHQKTFQATNYVEKYKGEYVRKMKIGYYCEVCNVVIHTLAKIGVHIQDDAHINNKSVKLLKRCDGGVIFFDDILIEINAWHGLSDGSCLICEVDYLTEADHKNETTHILNLIQSKLELNENKFVYRKIDENSYNCLVCNTIIAKSSKYIHCDSSEHKDNYIKCQDKKIKIKAYEYKIEENKNKEKFEKSDEKNMLAENSTPNRNSTKIIALANHKIDKTSEDDDEVLTPSEALSKAMEFAKNNNLKYKRNSTYCKFCNITISSSLKQMREHIAEPSHQAKALEKKKLDKKRKFNKVPMQAFVQSATGVQNVFYYGVVINDELCMNMLSFCMISINDGRARCQVCEMNLSLSDIEDHKKFPRHQYAMQITPVITDFKTEFIRELRPDIYHCGCCNSVEAGWEQLENHLKSVNHYERKNIDRKILQEYLKNDLDENFEQRKMLAMLSHFFRN